MTVAGDSKGKKDVSNRYNKQRQSTNNHQMKKLFFAAILMTLPFAMQAQLGKNLLNKAKSKIQQRADAKVDQAMDKTLDEAENSVKKGKEIQTQVPALMPMKQIIPLLLPTLLMNQKKRSQPD
jgi:hypothetical protein